MRLAFAFLLSSCLLITVCSAQTQKGNMLTHHPYPAFQLSQDGKTLGVLAKGEDGTEWMNFIDLTTFGWKSRGSVSTKSATITPDLLSAFGNICSEKGFKGDQHWLPYKKFTSWYYPNSTEIEIKQFPDQHIILAKRSDGKLITGGSLSFKKEKHFPEPVITMNDLNITDPATGQVVQNLRKGKIMTVPMDLWNKRSPVLLNEDSLLVWSRDGGWSTLNVYDGNLVHFRTQHPIDALSGRYGLGGQSLAHTSFSKPGDTRWRRFLVDMATGQTIYNDTISLKEGMSLFAATGANNRFYTLNGGTGILEQLEWNGQNLAIVASQQLAWKETFPNDFWKWIERYNYKLLVSESTGQVLLTPNHFKEGHELTSNRLVTWKLKNGDLAFDNPRFIQPHGSHLAQQRAQTERMNNLQAAADVKLVPNVWVRKQGGLTYKVLGKNTNGTLWDVVQYELRKDGSWSTYKTVKAEFDLTYQCTMLNPRTCGQCNGAGTVASVAQRTTEKTDKMIYNKITTTKTENVYSTHNCGQCKGAGVLF